MHGIANKVWPNYRRALCASLGPKLHQFLWRGPDQSHHVTVLHWTPIAVLADHSYELTSWGESAGAISVALQMLTNGGNTEGLFRAAFMQSGSPIPTSDITGGQETYDRIVKEVGCSNAADTLDCLRSVSYDALATAADLTPNIFSEEVRATYASLATFHSMEILLLCSFH